MQLNLNRRTYTDKSIIGTLDVVNAAGNNVFSCVTLEPPEDPTLSIKPRAIPEGTYSLSTIHSEHFGCRVLLLANVPDFSNVEIHFGNFPKDTHGCILVGEKVDSAPDQIDQSRIAFDKIMELAAGAFNSDDPLSLVVSGNQSAHGPQDEA